MSAVHVAKETSGKLLMGHQTVGTTRAKLTDTPFNLARGVLLRCPTNDDPVPNTAPVWVGNNDVSADSTVTGGLPVVPGASVFIPIEDPSKLYVVSTANGQDIAWIAL